MRTVGSTAVALFASQAMLAIGGVLAARALGPAGKGIVAAVTTWPMMLGYLSMFGINISATVRIAQRDRDGLPSTLGSAVAYSIVAGGVVALAAIMIVPRELSHLGPQASELTVWALATIPIILFGDIMMTINVALGRVKLANWCRVVPPGMVLLGTIVLLLAGAVTPAWIVGLNIVAGVPALAIGSVRLPWRRIVVKAPELLSDLKFGAKAHLATVLAITNVRLDVLLISVFLPASQLGYYSVANNMMLPVMIGAQAAALLLTPRVARMGHVDGRGGIDAGQLASIWSDVRLFGMIGVGGAVLVAVGTPFVVPLVFGNAFRPVSVLVWVLLPGYVARNFGALMSAGALGGRRPWVGNVAEGAGVVVTFALLPFLLPRYQALGAAITSTLAYSVTALVALIAIRRFGVRAPAGSVPDTDAAAAAGEPADVLALRAGG